MLSQTLISGLLFTALLASAPVDTRLADAAMQGNRASVRSLLKRKADVNGAQGDGMTALHWAAYQDDLEMLKLLLAAGAKVGAATRVGALTPLLLACTNGNPAMLEALLKAGAGVNLANANGTTALMLASSSGNAEGVRVLLDHGANVNAKEAARGQTALMFAAALNRDAVVRLLLARGADANVATSSREVEKVSFDRDGHIFYHPVTAKSVAASGAKPTAATAVVGKEKTAITVVEQEKTNQTADAKVAETKVTETKVADTKVVEAKVAEAKVAADAATKVATDTAAKVAMDTATKAVTEAARSDLTLLSRALGFQSAQVLLAKPRAGDAAARLSPPMRVGPEFVGGMTALLYATREGHVEATRALVEGGANINQVSADKFSPLVMAIANGHLDLAMYLLQRGADPNLPTLTGLTALYATVDVQWAPHASYPQPNLEQEKTGYLDLMKALLEHGAKVNALLGEKPWFRALFSDPTWVNPAGATAFWRAAQSSDIAAMRLLIAHGADPKIATKSGHTPLMAAAGVGWASNWSVNAPVPLNEAVEYCVELGNDVNAVDSRGYTPLHGSAYIGNNEMVLYLVEKGAKVDVKSKAGDSPADMANGPWRFGLPHPETVALLERLGSPNSHNCRSDKCVVAAKPLSPAEQADQAALERLASVLGFRSAVYLTDPKVVSSGQN
ncbi:MAG: ankyrin repeat domain-containing protein [Pyrinomonadaceae bacterium]